MKLFNPSSIGSIDAVIDDEAIVSELIKVPKAVGTCYFCDWDSGSDTANTGLTWASPYKSITKALTVAGNYATIYVKQGIYLEGATLAVTQAGLRIIGVLNHHAQFGQPSIHTHGVETLMTINANQVELANLAFHDQGAGTSVALGTTTATWRTHIHDCFFGGNDTALYGVDMNGLMDSPNTVVERCYFAGYKTAAIHFSSHESTVRDCIFQIRTADTGILYASNSADRPYGNILNCKFFSSDSTDSIGISVSNTPTAGLLMVDGNSFVNFASDDKCISKRTGYTGLNYHNGVRMGYKTSSVAQKTILTMDFWSPQVEEVQVAAAAGTLTLPTVTITDLPTGAVVVHARAYFMYRAIENTNAAANKLDGATVANTSQVIQVANDTPGTYVDAINFVDDQLGLAAYGREGGGLIIGNVDIGSTVIGNDGYLFKWLLANADQDVLNFNDVQTGLRIFYTLE